MFRRVLFFVCFLFIVTFFQKVSNFVYAQTSTTSDNQTAEELKSDLDSLSSKIKSLDAEIKSYNLKISKTRGDAKTLKQALANLEDRRKLLSKDIEYTKLRIIRAQENIVFTKDKIEATETVLERNKKALSESLRLIMHNEQSVPPFIGALAPGSHLSDAIEIIKRGGDATNGINEKVRALLDTKTSLALQKASYESRKHILENLNETLTDQKVLVEQTSKDKNTLLTQTKNKETEYQKLLADKKSKKDKLETEMIDVESKLRVIVDVSKLPTVGKGILQYPVDKVVVTQYFGTTAFSTKNPQVYNGSGHNGIDFGIPVGTPIYSALAGTVIGTGNTDASCSGVSYGKWVLVRHTNGLTTLYAHLSVISVSTGDKVTTRQKVGLSGNTGYSTGPHLHFTVYASDSVHVSGPTEYKSKVCGTYMIMPLAPKAGYLNPLSYL
ncbi:MAG: peptidoglycan DD-metalloendopeptidase family protein [Candidatus Pacebacteria bacterium]|nr:peptidoglycan DD-metalloendopeptidase family protein [Candidatus Paceibacterota bacterium]MBP9867182.1 peptidoglycan DD-metalloendopeptidase family protein [Candidatus Paceibacterota bacterium]